MANSNAMVFSSNGELVIDAEGKVIVAESKYYNDNLKNIVRFDLEEYRKYYQGEPAPSSYDILDLGYWTDTGQYEPPEMDWRKNHHDIDYKFVAT